MNEAATLPDSEYEGWALIEIFGHTKVSGHVREVSMAGGRMLRCDVPGPNGMETALCTQYFGSAAIFSLTPCDEATARKALEATYNLPAPVQLAMEALQPKIALDGPKDAPEVDKENPERPPHCPKCGSVDGNLECDECFIF